MGVRNSSTTQVATVFDQLTDLDPTGRAWLDRLIRLGHRSAHVALPDEVGMLDPASLRKWGKNEVRLDPPDSLLEWLVQNVPPKVVERFSKSAEVVQKQPSETLRKRRALAEKDPETIQEALRLLRKGERGRRWFVLEGASCPDAFLETERLILVVEGKRTEKTTTTKTTWMPRRSQLLRHMDAALERANGRPVFGLFLVEGEDPNPMVVPERWRKACDQTCEEEMLEASLPHRSDSERARIGRNVLGAATWQRVCAEFGIAWPPDAKLPKVSAIL